MMRRRIRPRRFAHVPVLALALALAGCGQPQPKQEEFPRVEAPSADTAIGPEGAAGIRTALAMNVEAVRVAAPHFIVAEAPNQVEGGAVAAITLSAGDEEVFRVLPSADSAHIRAIVTRSAQARGPMQEIVGHTLFGVAPPEEVPFCEAEQVDGVAGFACSTHAAGRFWRVYRLPQAYDGPAAEFGEIEPDVLHDATLAEMRWIAPQPQ